MAVLPWWAFAKVSFDAVVDRKVDRPCGKVAEDGGPEAAVHAAHAVMLEDVLDGRWQTEGESTHVERGVLRAGAPRRRDGGGDERPHQPHRGSLASNGPRAGLGAWS